MKNWVCLNSFVGLSARRLASTQDTTKAAQRLRKTNKGEMSPVHRGTFVLGYAQRLRVKMILVNEELNYFFKRVLSLIYRRAASLSLFATGSLFEEEDLADPERIAFR